MESTQETNIKLQSVMYMPLSSHCKMMPVAGKRLQKFKVRKMASILLKCL